MTAIVIESANPVLTPPARLDIESARSRLALATSGIGQGEADLPERIALSIAVSPTTTTEVP